MTIMQANDDFWVAFLWALDRVSRTMGEAADKASDYWGAYCAGGEL